MNDVRVLQHSELMLRFSRVHHCVTRKMASCGCKEVCSKPRQGFEFHQNEFSRKITWWGFTQRCLRSSPPSLVTCKGKELGLGEKGSGGVSPSLSRLGTDHTSPRPACCMGRICLGLSCGSLEPGTNYEWKTNFLFKSEPEEAAPEPPHHMLWTAPLETARQHL